VNIRKATETDYDGVWKIFSAVVEKGDTSAGAGVSLVLSVITSPSTAQPNTPPKRWTAFKGGIAFEKNPLFLQLWFLSSRTKN